MLNKHVLRRVAVYIWKYLLQHSKSSAYHIRDVFKILAKQVHCCSMFFFAGFNASDLMSLLLLVLVSAIQWWNYLILFQPIYRPSPVGQCWQDMLILFWPAFSGINALSRCVHILAWILSLISFFSPLFHANLHLCRWKAMNYKSSAAPCKHNLSVLLLIGIKSEQVSCKRDLTYWWLSVDFLYKLDMILFLWIISLMSKKFNSLFFKCVLVLLEWWSLPWFSKELERELVKMNLLHMTGT